MTGAKGNYDSQGWNADGVPAMGFTGEYQGSGMVYLRARWYNPTAGTFLSKDPFAGYNEQPYSKLPYQYGYGNPVSNTDPSGKSPNCQINSMWCDIADKETTKKSGWLLLCDAAVLRAIVSCLCPWSASASLYSCARG